MENNVIDASKLMDLSKVDEVIEVDSKTGEIALSQEAMAFISQVDLLERWSKDGKKRMQAILMEKMKEHGIRQLKSDDITVSYQEAGERISLDSKKVEAEYPRVYQDCLRASEIKEQVKIRRK